MKACSGEWERSKVKLVKMPGASDAVKGKFGDELVLSTLKY